MRSYDWRVLRLYNVSYASVSRPFCASENADRITHRFNCLYVSFPGDSNGRHSIAAVQPRSGDASDFVMFNHTSHITDTIVNTMALRDCRLLSSGSYNYPWMLTVVDLAEI